MQVQMKLKELKESSEGIGLRVITDKMEVVRLCAGQGNPLKITLALIL